MTPPRETLHAETLHFLAADSLSANPRRAAAAAYAAQCVKEVAALREQVEAVESARQHDQSRAIRAVQGVPVPARGAEEAEAQVTAPTPDAVAQARDKYNECIIANYESLQGAAGIESEDAAWAEVIRAVEARVRGEQDRDYRTTTGCLHARHEACANCECSECGSRVVRLTKDGMTLTLPLSTIPAIAEAL